MIAIEDDEVLELLPKREEIRTAIHVEKKKVAPIAKEHTSSKRDLWQGKCDCFLLKVRNFNLQSWTGTLGVYAIEQQHSPSFA